MKVIVCDPIATEAVQKMADAGLQVDVKTGMAPEELLETIPDYEAMVIRSATKVTREVLETATKLKIVARGGVGLDNVDRAFAAEKGVEVVNTPGCSSLSVAELTFGHMLSLSRHLAVANRSMNDGLWEKKRFKGVEISGKTLGIVGIGNIGGEVARLAKGFDMKLLCTDPFVTPEAAAEMAAELVELDDLLARADYVTLHLPLIDETRNMINAEKLALMKPTAYLIDCARGGVVDEDALAAALRDGTLGGAALDVYAKEPLADGSPLRVIDNLVLTPHIGASTQEGQLRVGMMVAHKIIAFLL